MSSRLLGSPLALATVLVVSGLLRLAWPAAWPEVLPDEGLWTNSAKNFLLFGDWFLDGRTHVFLSPVFHVLSLVAFSLWEPSIAAARLVSGVAGTLSVWLLYWLVHRLTGRRELALATAILFGVSEFTVNLSRQAMIEPLELLFSLAAAVLIVRGTLRALLAAALCLALGLLTKIHLLPVIGALALYCALPAQDRRGFEWVGPSRAVVVFTASVGVAALVYGLLYIIAPDRFLSAFEFALGSSVSNPDANPLLRAGRLGLDPVLAARSVIAIFRESPFLLVLATLGVALSLNALPRGTALFGPWLVIGALGQFAQLYQQTRYFYVLAPPICFFAAHAIQSLSLDPQRARRVAAAELALAAYLVFEISFIGMNAVANPARKVAALEAWASQHMAPSDRVMAAGYLCTGLPQRAYGHYFFSRSPAELLASIETHRIDWVVYDDQEWSPGLRDLLESHFPVAARLPFGAVYRVRRAD